MKRLSKDELDVILAEHEKWIVDKQTGRQAFFEGVEFSDFNFPSDCTVSGCTVSDCTVYDCTVFHCTVSHCKVSGGTVSYCTVSGSTVSDCTVSDCTVSGGTVSYCTVSDCKVSDCTVSYCKVSDKPAIEIKGFTGLYKYNVWAVLFADGSRWVKMGCLFNSLEEWERIGIRNSNLEEFPDNGSEKSEERVRAFEFAKATALEMKVRETQHKESE